jgi:hypothetical protein
MLPARTSLVRLVLHKQIGNGFAGIRLFAQSAVNESRMAARPQMAVYTAIDVIFLTFFQESRIALVNPVQGPLR